MGEFQLIEWIRHRVCEDDSGLIIGIGDDAAGLRSLSADFWTWQENAALP